MTLKNMLWPLLALQLAACASVAPEQTMEDSAETESDAVILQFFQEYVDTQNAHDDAVIDFYATDARLQGQQLLDNNEVRDVEISIDQYRQVISQINTASEAAGENYQFSNIKVSWFGEIARVEADRWVSTKCYNDEDYYVLIGFDDQQQWKIIEEFQVEPQSSQCVASDEAEFDPNLPAILQQVTAAFAASLPMMIDEDSELYAVTSEQNYLTYSYRLVNFYAEDLDIDYFNELMIESTTATLCGEATYDSLFSMGTVFHFHYVDLLDEYVSEFEITAQSCL